jgi:endo-1,4-beta-xylanase
VTDAAGCAGSAQKSLSIVPPTFADVPASHPFYAYVEAVAREGITAGCGSGNYCPSAPVSRGQAAVLLLRSREGGAYTPPPCTSPMFADVPCSHGFSAWINELARRGITTGCGGGNYCPDSAVTRAQASVFLLRTLLGAGYIPPACTTPTFADVPCSDFFASWIEDLVARGITSGCGGGNFCPTQAVSRGQTAAFLVRTFGVSVVW